MKIARILKLRGDNDIVRQNIAYYHNLGVEMTYVMLHKPTKKTLDALKTLNYPVIYMSWEKEGKGCDEINEELLKVLTDRAMKDGYRWIIGADADEFIVLNKHKILQEFLNKYDRYQSVSLLFKWANYYAVPVLKNIFKDMSYRSDWLRWTKSSGKFNSSMYFVMGLHYIADMTYGQIQNIREKEVDPDDAFYAHFPVRTREQFVEKLLVNGERFETAYYVEHGKDMDFYNGIWNSYLKNQVEHVRKDSKICKEKIYDPIDEELCKIKE
jgi:hypothetical protein